MKYCFVASITILVLAWLFYSPIMGVLGVCLLIFTLILFFSGQDSKFVNDNLFILSLLFFIVPTILVFFSWSQTDFYVTGWGSEKHLYEDCQKISSKKTHQVSTTSALLINCLDLCETCQERKQIERQKKEEDIRNSELQIIQSKIEELIEVKQRIENGESVDISDYTFLYELNAEDIRDMYEDMKDFPW